MKYCSTFVHISSSIARCCFQTRINMLLNLMVWIPFPPCAVNSVLNKDTKIYIIACELYVRECVCLLNIIPIYADIQINVKGAHTVLPPVTVWHEVFILNNNNNKVLKVSDKLLIPTEYGYIEHLRFKWKWLHFNKFQQMAEFSPVFWSILVDEQWMTDVFTLIK